MSSRLAVTAVVGLLAVSSAAGTVLAVERAVVRISVQPMAVQLTAFELTGAPAGHKLTTTPLAASAAESLAVPSAMTQLPATFAAGFVYFWCSPMTSCPNGYTVSAGTLLRSEGGATYVTDSSASFPSCQPSAMVAIHAATPGSVGNAGAGTVVYGQFPGYIHVTNSRAVGGGADARAVPIVTQSSIDTASAALTAKVAADLNAELRVEAGPRTYVSVGSPVFKVASDAQAGDAAPSANVTVTGTLQGIAFSTKDALALVRGLLTHRAPGGYELTPAPVTATYSWDSALGGLTASAAAYAVPEIDTPALTADIRGEGLSEAAATLQRAIPGSTVRIQTAPFVSPWLPVLSDHISMVLATSPA